MADRYRLTINGGMTIATGNLPKIALTIAGQPDGMRYVRDVARPNYVATVDMQRAVLGVTDHGIVVTDSRLWPDWVHSLVTLLHINFPHLSTHHEGDTDGQGHHTPGTTDD